MCFVCHHRLLIPNGAPARHANRHHRAEDVAGKRWMPSWNQDPVSEIEATPHRTAVANCQSPLRVTIPTYAASTRNRRVAISARTVDRCGIVLVRSSAARKRFRVSSSFVASSQLPRRDGEPSSDVDWVAGPGRRMVATPGGVDVIAQGRAARPASWTLAGESAGGRVVHCRVAGHASKGDPQRVVGTEAYRIVPLYALRKCEDAPHAMPCRLRGQALARELHLFANGVERLDSASPNGVPSFAPVMRRERQGECEEGFDGLVL